MAPAALQFLASAATALGITRLERDVEVSNAIKLLQVLRKSAAKERPKLVPALEGRESEFLCLEFDEAKLSQMLKKLSEIEDSMTLLTQTT
uniref:COMM domain-containing protein 1 n=1 Tax=Columba livia TaxID=8932 RepID=R7VVV8_COLLI